MKPEEALDYIRSCRDTHLDWTVEDVLAEYREPVFPEAAVAFHEDCVKGYNEALEALEGLVLGCWKNTTGAGISYRVRTDRASGLCTPCAESLGAS